MDFETLLSRSPNPYIVVDRDLLIAWMNDAYLRATMRERTELVGRPLFEAFPSDPSSASYKLLRSSLDRVLRTRSADEIAHIRYDIARPDGIMEQRYWSATHTPQLDDGGEVKFILQHTVDVTELHRLRKLRDEAGLVDRAKALQARYFDLAREAEWLKEIFR
jgi:PAS domain S-box-containing protein